jgi:hypothetical protein
VSQKICLGVVLVLLNSPSDRVRIEAVRLADAMLSPLESLETIEVFNQTEKPHSVGKYPVKGVPMKPKSVQTLL